MKKFICISFGLLLLALSVSAQPMMSGYVPDLSDYTIVQSYPIEHHYFYSEREINDEKIISFGSGYYMVKVDKAPDFVVKYKNDKAKAIIVGSPIPAEYEVTETDSRVTMYNKKPYYGFVYDKKYKVLYHFTSKKYHKRFDRFMRKRPVMP